MCLVASKKVCTSKSSRTTLFCFQHKFFSGYSYDLISALQAHTVYSSKGVLKSRQFDPLQMGERIKSSSYIKSNQLRNSTLYFHWVTINQCEKFEEVYIPVKEKLYDFQKLSCLSLCLYHIIIWMKKAFYLVSNRN